MFVTICVLCFFEKNNSAKKHLTTLEKHDIKSNVFIHLSGRSILTITASLCSSKPQRRIVSFIRPITSFRYILVEVIL